MGAPKQKWTSEEEAALKAGVHKHGAGKWRTILKDPHYSSILSLRSNVDLKDKWRNMSVMANGWGSREKARLALKRIHHHPHPNSRHDDNPLALSNVLDSDDDETVDAKPLAISGGTSPLVGASKRSIIRLDNLIMEAINNLQDRGGSNKTTIGTYIEEEYWAPPNFKRLLSAKLKYLTACGKLIKTKRKYRIASPSEKRKKSPMLLLEGRQQKGLKADNNTNNNNNNNDNDNLNREEYHKSISKSQVDVELARMRNMSPQEAALAAAEAVAEAEAAMAEAEEAAREAEAAEADAEAAQAFAEAAMKTLKGRTAAPPRMMVQA
jgi:myb proto-oncogene protein